MTDTRGQERFMLTLIRTDTRAKSVYVDLDNDKIRGPRVFMLTLIKTDTRAKGGLYGVILTLIMTDAMGFILTLIMTITMDKRGLY